VKRKILAVPGTELDRPVVNFTTDRTVSAQLRNYERLLTSCFLALNNQLLKTFGKDESKIVPAAKTAPSHEDIWGEWL
jgi:hypothetical protein